MSPTPSDSILLAASSSEPPRYVEKIRAEPSAFNLATNASPPDVVLLPAPPYVDCTTPAVAGKLEELVLPPTIALPEASTVIADTLSSPWPPRYVAYTNELPEASSFAINPS